MKRLREKKIDTPEFYEKIWNKETNERPYYDAVRQRALIKHVKDSDTVLDVGAGVYGACQYIAEETDLRTILTCLDFSYTAKDIVDRMKLPIEYKVGNADKTKFSNGSFNIVIAGELIEHMEDPAAFAKELARITQPGGWISISTVNTKSENAIKHGEYIEHLWEFTPEDLTGFFKPFGEVTYEKLGDYHLIYCKRI